MNISSHTALVSHCFFNLSRYTPPLLLLLKFLLIPLSQKKLSFIILLKWDRDKGAESVNFQMLRYWCASKAEQRVEERIKIIILLWANNSQTVSIESLTGAENWTVLLFFRGKAASRGSYGDKPDFANIYLHIEMWERQRKLRDEGDLFPVVVLLYFLPNHERI